MSLEEAALKESGAHLSPRSKQPRPPRTFDRLVRFVAMALLLGLLTVIYWVPMALMDGYFAAAFVLAVLTMLGAGVASRLYHLRVRVQALEVVLDEQDQRHRAGQTATMPPAAPATDRPSLEEVQQQP